MFTVVVTERDHRKKMYKGNADRKKSVVNSSSGESIKKALSRAGDIPEGSWICLSHRNLILAEDKRCSCPSSWGHGKILSKRPIPESLFAVFDEVGRNSVTEYKSATNWSNKCSIRADKDFASHPHVHTQEAKKVTSENKVKHTKLNKIMFSAILIHCLLLNIMIIYSKTDKQII